MHYLYGSEIISFTVPPRNSYCCVCVFAAIPPYSFLDQTTLISRSRKWPPCYNNPPWVYPLWDIIQYRNTRIDSKQATCLLVITKTQHSERHQTSFFFFLSIYTILISRLINSIHHGGTETEPTVP